MIIWGSYVMHKRLGVGEFYCPHCATSRRYEHKRPRRWGHLYWIPLIPMDTYDPYVECLTCTKGFVEEALHHDPRRERETILTGLSGMIGQVMMQVAKADGRRVKAAEVGAAAREVIGADDIPEAVSTDLPDGKDKAGMLEEVRAFGIYLAPKGQETLLRLAAGPNALSPAGRALMAEIGEALGMTPAHVNGLLAEVA